MLLFWDFQKSSLIKKSMEQSKNKSVKSVITKYYSLKSLSSISIAYDSYILELLY